MSAEIQEKLFSTISTVGKCITNTQQKSVDSEVSWEMMNAKFGNK